MPLSPGHVRRPHSRRGHLSLQPVVGVHGGQVRKVRLDTSAGPGSTRTGFLAHTCPGGRRGVAGLGKDVRGGGRAGRSGDPSTPQGLQSHVQHEACAQQGLPAFTRRPWGSCGAQTRREPGGRGPCRPRWGLGDVACSAQHGALGGSLPLSRTPTEEAVSSPCRGGRAPCGHLGAPEATASVKAPACRVPGPRWSLTVWREALALLGQRQHETAPRDVPLRGAAAGGWKGRRRGAGG